jgi:hypothetical protein
MRIKTIVALLVFGLVAYLFLAWPRHVNFDLKGIQYTQTDKSIGDNVSVQIDGQIHNKFFGVYKFNGRIYCEAIDLNGEYFNLIFEDSNKSYLSIRNENEELISYGEIFADRNMKELVLVNGDDVLVFPSNTREEAEEIANRHFMNEYNNYF